MKLISILLILFAFLFITAPVGAVSDPLAVPNNRYGIHIMNPGDLEDAAKLVNSSGGSWGYVTLVIRQDEIDVDKWNSVFDQLELLKLIPIVRIATVSQNDVWEKLKPEDIDIWVEFLDSLDWPVINRYVVVANEPNHAREWGGEINPPEYANYLEAFSVAAKGKSQDFFVLNAGFDASAPDDLLHMEEEKFIKAMIEENPDVFDHIDGWSSHSYPNPAFSGSSSDTGRGTIKTYEWEIDLLKTFGVNRNLPVFITETGWAHDIEGNVKGMTSYGTQRFEFKSIDDVAGEYKNAFENPWNDDRIVAITPFVLSHPDYPFENFSWKSKSGSYYKFFDEVSAMTKQKGEPARINEWAIIEVHKINDQLAIALIENKGHVVWDVSGSMQSGDLSVTIRPIHGEIKPNEKGLAYIEVREGSLPTTSSEVGFSE